MGDDVTSRLTDLGYTEDPDNIPDHWKTSWEILGETVMSEYQEGYTTQENRQEVDETGRGAQFDKMTELCKNLFLEKNAQYGDSIAATGVLGASVSLVGAVARLPVLVLKDPTHGEAHREALIDIFQDIANYAIIGLIMLSEGNWSGK